MDDCVSAEQLERWIHGELDDAEAARVAAHLDSCPRCQVRSEEAQANDLAAARLRAYHRERAGNADHTSESIRSRTGRVDLQRLIHENPDCGRDGKYLLLDKLGQGGFGEVWLAQDTELKRLTALKFFFAGDGGQGTRLRLLLEEARAASAVQHPNVVAIHSVGRFEPAGLDYIDMSLCGDPDEAAPHRRSRRHVAQDMGNRGRRPAPAVR